MLQPWPLQQIATVVLMVSAVTGCSQEKSTTSTKAGDFAGTWIKGEDGTCEPTGKSTTAKKTTLTIAQDFSYTQVVEVYTDRECKSLAITATQFGRINFRTSKPKVEEATVISLSADRFDLAWNSADGVAAANDGDGYCTLKEWTIDVAKNVTNQDCKSKEGENISAAYRSRADGRKNSDRNIMKLTSDKAKLIFGDDQSRENADDPEDKCELIEDGKTAESCYPTKIGTDTSLHFYRKK